MDVLKLLNIDNKLRENLIEIRIRINSPIFLYIYENNSISEYILNKNGTITNEICFKNVVFGDYFNDIINALFENSIYSYKDELNKGFFTLEDGSRIGVCGEVLIKDDKIDSFKNITSLNIRIAKDVFGASKPLMEHILIDKCKVNNTLIIAPPASGKTTILRDLGYNLSSSNSYLLKPLNVSVIDERYEIFPTNLKRRKEISRIDVISGANKVIASEFLIRSVNPDVILLDEIGYSDDICLLSKMITCGVSFICTMHGKSLNDAKKRFGQDLSVFDKIIIINKNVGNNLNIKSSNNSFYSFLCMEKIDE